MNGVIWQSEKLMLYSAPSPTSCSTLHDADSSTHSDWLSVFAVCSSIFHPLKFYPTCNSLQLGNQLKTSPTCMQFVPENQPRMEFDERLAVPRSRRLWFTIYTTEREQSQQYTQRRADERRARRQECEFSLKKFATLLRRISIHII